jgi:hypothetical protein
LYAPKGILTVILLNGLLLLSQGKTSASFPKIILTASLPAGPCSPSSPFAPSDVITIVCLSKTFDPAVSNNSTRIFVNVSDVVGGYVFEDSVELVVYFTSEVSPEYSVILNFPAKAFVVAADGDTYVSVALAIKLAGLSVTVEMFPWSFKITLLFKAKASTLKL